jgi:hypothetical protein
MIEIMPGKIAEARVIAGRVIMDRRRRLTVADWITHNGHHQTGNILSTAAAGWKVVGAGDFSGDGTSDVILQNGGTVVDW